MISKPFSSAISRALAVALAFAINGVVAAGASAQIAFQDVSIAAGLGNTNTQTWGASWGDLDGDHYPDLFSSNHMQRATLFHNNHNGTFTDVSKQVDLSKTPGWTGGKMNVDTHGASWGDFNNDGQEDLYETVSSTASHLWLNQGGKLTLVTTAEGVDQFTTRSNRQALFLDFNGDGRLDIGEIGLRSPRFSPQLSDGTFGHGFSGPNSEKPMACSSEGQWGILTDINDASPMLEMICAVRTGTFPKVNGFANGTIADLTSQYAQLTQINDAATLDYDGDLRPDMFLVRNAERGSGAYQYSTQGLEAQFITGANVTRSITFKTTGILTITVSLRAGQDTAPNDPQNDGDPRFIDIGTSQWSPTSLTFQLDSADPNSWGIATGSLGINIGYLPDTGQWKVSQGNGGYSYSYVQITSTADISELAFIGATATDIGLAPYMWHNTPTGMVLVKKIGLDAKEQCVSAVSGDFDNDMHEDLYVACTGAANNISNRLFRNNGNGTFTEIANAGGAGGITGAAIHDHAGTSESVVTADYDLDGCLDLLVTNGLNMRPLFTGGPKQLFHNLCNNGNKWMEFDLVGTTSNRDGIGSKVYVTTAGPVTQYREQSGGYHRWSQNFMRVHVGLAANVQADVTVVWPDGHSITYPALPANHIYQLKQDGNSVLIQ